jgi:hypothetical protein
VINGTVAAAKIANVTSALVSRGGAILQELPQLLQRAEDEVEVGSEHSNTVVYIFR